jgi:hypothetical protein
MEAGDPTANRGPFVEFTPIFAVETSNASMIRQGIVASVFLLFASFATAQVAPPRDRPNGSPPPLVGTGVIKGRVVDGQSGTAVTRARVRLNYVGPGVQRPTVTTDDSGTFVFSGLPAGSYMLMADK